MKWVTRARPKVDRVACPWLIKRFVDPDAEFLYVPADQVIEVAKGEGATPFDVPNVELGHHGPECTFDAIIKKYELADPALRRLARIVRGADTAAKDKVVTDFRLLLTFGGLPPSEIPQELPWAASVVGVARPPRRRLRGLDNRERKKSALKAGAPKSPSHSK